MHPHICEAIQKPLALGTPRQTCAMGIRDILRFQTSDLHSSAHQAAWLYLARKPYRHSDTSLLLYLIQTETSFGHTQIWHWSEMDRKA